MTEPSTESVDVLCTSAVRSVNEAIEKLSALIEPEPVAPEVSSETNFPSRVRGLMKIDVTGTNSGETSKTCVVADTNVLTDGGEELNDCVRTMIGELYDG